MKRGDIVIVYHDPITREEPEGKARLIRKLGVLGGGAEHWLVHFIVDSKGRNCERSVVPEALSHA